MNPINHQSRTLILIVQVGILAALLITACTPSIPASALTPTAKPSPTTQPPFNTPTSTPGGAPATATAPAETPAPVPAPAAAAQKNLAQQLKVSTDAIKITSVEPVDWPNGCLGIVKPGMMCTDVIVPGYRVIMEAGGKTYEYRTDQSGKQIEQAPTDGSFPTQNPPSSGAVTPMNPADVPAAALKARDTLAQQIQAKPVDIQVVSVERVEWPNGCLGVQLPGRMCTQVIVPGYRVVFSYQGKQYEFHTDEAGGSVIQATAPLPQTADKVVTWQQTENNVCSRVEIGVQKAAFGTCAGALQEAPLGMARLKELRTLLSMYAPFETNTPSGNVFFNGQGTQQATPAEQRSVAEWAKLVRMEAESGRGGAAWGMAFGWHREGGIAGFCDDLAVYLTGFAQPSSCKGARPAALSEFRLNAAQLEKLYTWVDQYQNFDYEMKDPANAADAMATRLTFAGAGTKAAPAAVQSEVAQFASDLFTQAPK